LPGRWNDAGARSIENDVSDTPATKSGKSPARVRLAKVAFPMLLTAGAVFGYVSVEEDRGAPMGQSAPPASAVPEPVQDVVSAADADAVPEPPPPSPEPTTVEPAAEILPADTGLDRLRIALGNIRCAVLHEAGIAPDETVTIFNIDSAFEEQAAWPAERLQGSELYVAPLYNTLIAAGADIRFHRIAHEAVVFCSVPEEYDAFLKVPADA